MTGGRKKGRNTHFPAISEAVGYENIFELGGENRAGGSAQGPAEVEFLQQR